MVSTTFISQKWLGQSAVNTFNSKVNMLSMKLFLDTWVASFPGHLMFCFPHMTFQPPREVTEGLVQLLTSHSANGRYRKYLFARVISRDPVNLVLWSVLLLLTSSRAASRQQRSWFVFNRFLRRKQPRIDISVCWRPLSLNFLVKWRQLSAWSTATTWTVV